MRILSHIRGIINEINTHDVVVVSAPTGSGKSIGIPAGLARTNSRTFVVEPTRTATVSLSQYLKYVSPHINIGYASGDEIEYHNNTDVAYVTYGHMVNKLLGHFSKGRSKPITFCKVLLLDEYHNRNVDSTMIISLWLHARQQGIRVPRLVLLSATPAPIDLPVPISYYNINIDNPFEVTLRYIDSGSGIGQSGNPARTNNILDNAIKVTSKIKGNVIVFAPGSREVKYIGSKLEAIDDLIVVMAHGSMDRKEIDKIYKSAPEGKRKVVVTTNMAESSITIEDIDAVVDTMLEKRAESLNDDGTVLLLKYISKDSAVQRMGRIGRTKPGICYRLVSKYLYTSLEDHRLSEIEVSPIHNVVMKMLKVGLDPADTIITIDPNRVLESLNMLINLHMVNQENNIYTVTDIGHMGLDLSLSVRNTTFLYRWIEEGYPIFPGIVVACIIDRYSPGYFYYPSRNSDENIIEYNNRVNRYINDKFNKYYSDSTLATYLNMWRDYYDHFKDRALMVSPKLTARWAEHNSINHRKLRELLLCINRTISVLRDRQANVIVGPFTEKGVTQAAYPILIDTNYDRVFVRSGIYKENSYQLLSEAKGGRALCAINEYHINDRQPISEIGSNPPDAILNIGSYSIQGKFSIINMAIPVPVNDEIRKSLPKSKSRDRLPLAPGYKDGREN